MPETSARLLLLLSLLQARREWPTGELAARLEVSRRTVRRDVDRLRDLGYPVHVTRGPGAAYRLDAGSRLPPLLFDDEQAVAVAVALRTAPTTVSGIDEAAARALATIRQVMPARLRHAIDAMRVTPLANPWELAAPRVDSGLLLALGTAVRGGEVLAFDYLDHSGPGEGRQPARRVEPHHLVIWSGRWYLAGWDQGLPGWAAFRVDRIGEPTATGRRFTRRELPGADVAAFVTSQFDRGDVPGHWPCRGEVVLDAPAEVVARWAPGGPVVEALGPDRCRLVLGAWSWTGLAALVGTFAADIEVIGPPELVAACAELSHRYAAAAGIPDPQGG
ncbi:WYL domain-containing protein [Saccharopolyspora erythraea]|uniref:helix-turn-helix transcriptional regulator n=1 Tax=Saccharopolyspora erythraea TaxID=1836 RepID=UPI001BA6E8B3|nr:WYL domain-containing protein [Saccharopolyspora erythraea]QUH01258.1 WYL domain-containing protein [Saccharopolyspora erythraea]